MDVVQVDDVGADGFYKVYESLGCASRKESVAVKEAGSQAVDILVRAIADVV